MTTCREIVSASLRKCGVRAPGEEPEAAEADNGMEVLSSMYLGWVADGVFGPLADVIVTEAYEALENERVVADSALTVTLPTEYDDECSDTGTRPPRDLAIVETVIEEARQVSVYDALSRAWVRLDNLTLASTAPFATRGADDLACALAMNYADEFRADLRPATVQKGRRFIRRLAAKPNRAPKASEADYF